MNRKSVLERTLRRLPALLILGGALFAGLGGCGVSPEAYKKLQSDNMNQAQEIRNLRDRNAELTSMVADLSQRAEMTEAQKAEFARLKRAVDWRRHFPAEMTASEGQYLVLTDVLFQAGAATLTDAGRQRLDQVADALNGMDLDRLVIEGHSDSQPLKITKDKYINNWHLSALRAIAVQEHLKAKGVPIEKTYIVGYGPTMPLEPGNNTKNRRVELRAYLAERDGN